ncbi:hypothetical protein [Pilimelia columellifera]
MAVRSNFSRGYLCNVESGRRKPRRKWSWHTRRWRRRWIDAH